MKRLSFVLVVLLVSLMASSAFANFDFNVPVGDWDVAANWYDTNKSAMGTKPDGTDEIQIRNDTVVTLDTAEGPFATPGYNWEYTRVYGGATLNIVDGAALRATSWLRVGTGGTIGTVNQTGGLVELNVGHSSDKLMIGDDPDSAGSEYRISGGTLTHIGTNGGLWMGYEAGTGQFTVVGTGGTIQMDDLYVGGDRKDESNVSDWGVGYLKYEIGAAGVSPIQLADMIYINRGSKTAGSLAHLVLQLDAAPPMNGDIPADIVLAKNASTNPIEADRYVPGSRARFDTVTGGAVFAYAHEGITVTLGFGGTDYAYALRYAYDADGTANDLALQGIPEPATLVLLGLGGLLLRRKK